MSKVIVERPRRGGNQTRKGRQIDEDLQVANEGMRAPHVRRYGGKELNENLAPLLRFVGSRVGRPWDEVWSEISKEIKATSAVQQHVRDHVMQFVETKTHIDEQGRIWTKDGRPMLLENARYVRFYVHPESGILYHNPHYRSWKNDARKAREDAEAEQASMRRSLPDGTELRKANGIWYEVTVGTLPPLKRTVIRGEDGRTFFKDANVTYAYDVIMEKTVSNSGSGRRDSITSYCKTKRQLNRGELRRHGLEND